jgi:hypothetical protein
VRWVVVVVRGLRREVVVLSFRVEVVLGFRMMEEVRAVVWGVLVLFMGDKEWGAYEFCDDGGGEEGCGFGYETGG